MGRILALLSALVIMISACTPIEQSTTIAADGKPAPKLYRLSRLKPADVQFRMLDSVNALRQAAGVGPLQFNAQLNAAAATHARDMSNQNRPWHFGSDGSSPIDRVQRAGFFGRLIGENISETFETELETLGAWMDQPDTRRVILAPEARSLGFSWFQEPNGKIWWTLVTGA
ncbi:MAG: CAP domain-containing protein [Paracoccaceae bacterium]